jgi:hypothetical protein
MTGPGASHTGSCDHCKSRGAPGYTYYQKSTVNLLIDTGASISAILFSPRPRSSKKITVQGVLGQPLEHYFTQHLACSWRDFHYCHSFLIIPETPIPLLRWDLLSKLGVQLLLPPGEYFCLPLIEEQVYPMVWMYGHTVGWAWTAVPVLIHLKEPSWFPYQKQYPLRPEVKEELIPIIKDLKRQGLLIECSSPYNTPILSIRKGPNNWRLVQDLCLINEAVVLLHPLLTNPYTLLAQIPPCTAYYSVLDLKDVFFCILLHCKSQLIFVFEDPTRKSGQVIWTILPQGFRDSCHLFGLALTQDLAEW